MRTRNKKKSAYGWLLSLTAIMLAVMGGVQYFSAAAISVTVTPAQRVTVKETVMCAGTVQAAQSVDVTVSVPCIVGDVRVTVGEQVEKGDVLLTVDRAATLAMAVGAGLSESQAVTASAALPQTVTAPQSGTVRVINAAKGDMLETQTPCVVLAKGGGVQIALTVRESTLKKLAVGQPVTVTGVAFEKEAYTGILSSIADSARSRVSGTTSETVVDAVVTLSPDQADASLLPGLSAKAAVTVDERENVLVVPYECVIQNTDGSTAVYCVQEGIAYRRSVTVGDEMSEGIEIVQGLQEGEWLVTDAGALSGEKVAVTTEAVV